jgi:hypothetical protein
MVYFSSKNPLVEVKYDPEILDLYFNQRPSENGLRIAHNKKTEN